MPMTLSRRQVLTTLSLAGAAGLPRLAPALAAEGPLETTTVRLVNDGSICIAPEYAAEELLRAEGFTDIRYVEVASEKQIEGLERGVVDFVLFVPPAHIPAIDTGFPVAVLAGVHVGCFELFAKEGIRSVADLKGKSVGLKAAPPALLTLMAAHVGLDAAKDISWVTDPSVKPLDLFAEGKIDAFLGFPPEPQELRARHAGHVIVNTSVDRPWSQYFCCMFASTREYVRQHPVATKRVLRAVLKATDLCVTEPAQVARRMPALPPNTTMQVRR
jgi:NitT/TauT family transport system substrate-binding protein